MYGVRYHSLADSKLICLRIGFDSFEAAHVWASECDPATKAEAMNVDGMSFNGLIVWHSLHG